MLEKVSLKGTIRTHNPGFSFFLGRKNDPPPADPEESRITNP